MDSFDYLKRIQNVNNQNCGPVDRLQPHIQSGQQQFNTMSGMAQTASVGDQEMMTYIKLSNPTSFNTDNCVNGENASDDAGEFLDGLFDRTSDNGSDRGDESNDGNIETSSRLTPTDNSKPRGSLNFSSSTNAINGPGQAIHSNSASTDAAATSGKVRLQLPQHMLYGTNPNSTPLPQNLLQFQSPCPAQGNSSNTAIKIEGSGTENNLTNLPHWMISSAQPCVPAISISATQQQTNPINTIVHPRGREEKPISVVRPVLTNNGNISAQSTITQSETDNKNLKGCPSHKRSFPLSSCASIGNTTTVTNNEVHKTPSIITSSSLSNKKNKPTPPPVSEDESDAQKRRRDRNQREQERSQRIATQIADLKDLLSQSDVPFKPDKYSTLVSVHTYIESLQKRIEDLDDEHKGLLDTIASADYIVNQSVLGGKQEEQEIPDQVQSSSGLSTSCQGEDENRTDTDLDSDIGYYVKGLDYKSLFVRCTVPLCVASIDGRLLACNEEFIDVCGLTKEVLQASGLLRGVGNENHGIKSEDVDCGGNLSTLSTCENKTTTPTQVLSLFNLLSRDNMGTVFEAMSSMLKSQSTDTSAQTSSLLNQWTGTVDSFSVVKRKIRLNISLVRQKCGTPKYFNCVLTPC